MFHEAAFEHAGCWDVSFTPLQSLRVRQIESAS